MGVSYEIRDAGQEEAANRFAAQARKLGYQKASPGLPRTRSYTAVEAKFVTGQDPVIEIADGKRLPTVPVDEALRLNRLKKAAFQGNTIACASPQTEVREGLDGTIHGTRLRGDTSSESPAAPLTQSVPLSKTNPLFPPLPMYGPPTLMRDLQCYFFRISSFFLSLLFLLVILLGSIFSALTDKLKNLRIRLSGRNPETLRPFHREEARRKLVRREREQRWNTQREGRFANKLRSSVSSDTDDSQSLDSERSEGGKDLLSTDPAYYARREGLDMEKFEVKTEDGFLIELWHLLDPRDRRQEPHMARGDAHKSTKYPVLMMHGLLQNSGAFCCTEDNSLAFFLAKSGYDVWLGNNRCGMVARHELLTYGDPRMWAWNIRQMGVMDLPALIDRVLRETGFEKLGLICHSQGTTQTFVALAKEQRPDIGEKISVFCALAPAVYAGPLIKKMYFKFMRIISPSMFRLLFGIHAFIPFMLQMHAMLPRKLYGILGYHVFSFLFDWTDDRWERDLRTRMFQFAPVFVSAESMRWWLGRECFAKHKCILATRDEGAMEDREDHAESDFASRDRQVRESVQENSGVSGSKDMARYSWYDARAPPMAFWICGNDHLVDGRRLLRRFERGREPHVNLVHKKVIEGYEHLDVIWAMDSIEKVAEEVREVIWRTASLDAKAQCQVPSGCDHVQHWERPPRE